VTAERSPEAGLFPDEKPSSPPAPGTVLSYLAQTLSVARTLKRFPALKPNDLQEILGRCARWVSEGEARPSPPPPGAGEISIHADGASRGNPGEAGAGVVFADERGKTLKEWKSYLGQTTNNVAEYRAVLLALEKASALGAESVIINMDSELVVRQLSGEYKVREPHLKALHQKALELLKGFRRYRLRHVPREENRRADQLANEAIDQKIRI
jgi:ribonuclease HI